MIRGRRTACSFVDYPSRGLENERFSLLLLLDLIRFEEGGQGHHVHDLANVTEPSGFWLVMITSMYNSSVEGCQRAVQDTMIMVRTQANVFY